MTKQIGAARVTVLAAGLVAMASGLAQAQSADAFYKGRDMKMILSAGQGGGYGTYAHALMPFMEKYLPGKPQDHHPAPAGRRRHRRRQSPL